MKRRRKGRVLLVSFVVVLSFVGVTACVLVMRRSMEGFYESRISEMQKIIDDGTAKVYVAAVDIAAGDEVNAEMLTEITNLFGVKQGLFTAADIGKVALVDVPVGSVLFSAMVTEERLGEGERFVEFSCFTLDSTIVKNDYIDVRIRYGNGEDFVVLPKKQVVNVSLPACTIFLRMTEQEIQMVASAIVDGNEFDAVLYTTRYIKPTIQEPSQITYIPRSEFDGILYEALGVTLYERLSLEERLLGVGSGVQAGNLSSPHGNTQSNNNGEGVVNTYGQSITEYIPIETP